VTRALLTALLALALLPAAAVGAEPRTTLPDVEDEVMCVECGTALNVSQSPVAEQERDFIRRRIAAGDTKEQIKAAMVDEYGRDVLAVPEDSGVGIAAWWLPIALVPLGLLAVLLAWRRWRATAAAGPTAAEAAAPPLDEDDTRRLDDELAAFDR
jgi:cytochrome c-type biogenesis protein CcmH